MCIVYLYQVRCHDGYIGLNIFVPYYFVGVLLSHSIIMIIIISISLNYLYMDQHFCLGSVQYLFILSIIKMLLPGTSVLEQCNICAVCKKWCPHTHTHTHTNLSIYFHTREELGQTREISKRRRNFERGKVDGKKENQRKEDRLKMKKKHCLGVLKFITPLSL